MCTLPLVDQRLLGCLLHCLGQAVHGRGRHGQRGCQPSEMGRWRGGTAVRCVCQGMWSTYHWSVYISNSWDSSVISATPSWGLRAQQKLVRQRFKSNFQSCNWYRSCTLCMVCNGPRPPIWRAERQRGSETYTMESSSALAGADSGPLCSLHRRTTMLVTLPGSRGAAVIRVASQASTQ